MDLDCAGRAVRGRQRLLAESPGLGGAASIDLTSVQRLDTAGAWLLQSTMRELGERGWRGGMGRRATPTPRCWQKFTGDHQAPAAGAGNQPAVTHRRQSGSSTLAALGEASRLLSFYGQTVLALLRLALQPGRLRLTSLVHHLEQTCVNALPIVGLIAFLIGIVMAYQGADQLRRFGAEIFTVDLR